MTDTSPPMAPRGSTAAQLIAQLQTRLLALGQTDELPTSEIERTAKAINQLIISIEKAETFLSHNSDQPRLGEPLMGERRIRLLRKIKRMVENGVLDELDD